MFAQDIVQHIAHYRCIWTEHQLEARNVLRNKIWYGQLRYDERAEDKGPGDVGVAFSLDGPVGGTGALV